MDDSDTTATSTGAAERRPSTGLTTLVMLLTVSAEMPSSMSLAGVEAHLFEVVERVTADHERVVITVQGVPAAVLMASSDVEGLEETLDVLADSEAVARLAASEAELVAGLGDSEPHLAAAMRARRGEPPS